MDAVVIEGGSVRLDSGCPLASGRVKHTKKGTMVTGKWKTCGDLQRVRLQALIKPDCNTMAGTIRAKKHKPSGFTATRSVCGDGILDRGNAEECDGPSGCREGGTCTEQCHCRGATPTTMPGVTTTSVSSSSTSTSTASSTTLPSSASCGNGLLEPGEKCDGDDDFACVGRCTPDCQCPASSIEVLHCYFARLTPIPHGVPGLVPIDDEPLAGQTYPVFLALTGAIENPVLELVSVAQPQTVIATAPLTLCDPDFPPECLQGSVAIPTDAFTVRVRGQVGGQPSLSGSSTKVFSPGPVSIEFLAQESDGFLPGTASRLLYLVTNPGPSRDFAVSVEDPGGGILVSPDPVTLHVEAGSTARFTVTVSIPSDTPMFDAFGVRSVVAVSDDDARRDRCTLLLAVEGQ